MEIMSGASVRVICIIITQVTPEGFLLKDVFMRTSYLFIVYVVFIVINETKANFSV